MRGEAVDLLGGGPRGRAFPARKSRGFATAASFAFAFGLFASVGSPRALAQASAPGETAAAGGTEAAEGAEAAGLSDEVAQERIAPVNVVKLLAQRAALPFLRGDDRFVLRESWWNGRIAPGDSKLIQVQLFSRNAYQFWLAVPSRDAAVDLHLYDSEGKLVETDFPEIEGTNIVSLFAEPDRSGLYYLRVALREGTEQEQEWGVIYAYR